MKHYDVKSEDEITDLEYATELSHHITNSEDRCAYGGSVVFPNPKPDYSLIPLHVKIMNDEIRARFGIMPRWSHELR